MAEMAEWIKSQNWEELVEKDGVVKAIENLKNVVEGGEEAGDDADDDCRRIKLVVVGDGAVGKTCLLIAFATGEFPTEYVPTVFENYSAKMKINDKAVFLHLWDTAGQEDYDRLRPLSYPDSDIVLLCFSTTSKNSYDSVQEKWNPEIKHYLPNTPVILVGTKVDLRDAKLEDKNAEKTEYVSQSDGTQLQNEIGALRYMEVSAKTACEEGGGGLQDIFLECVKTVLTDLEEEEDSGEEGNSSKVAQRNQKATKKPGCVLL